MHNLDNSDYPLLYVQVLGEAMTGISHNAKNSNLPAFGDSVSSGSKALCGLTEAAAQVNISFTKRIVTANHAYTCAEKIQKPCLSIIGMVCNAAGS